MGMSQFHGLTCGHLAPLFEFVLTRRLFIVALSVNAKYWKQCKCLYIGEWLKISRHIHTMEVYAHQKEKHMRTSSIN